MTSGVTRYIESPSVYAGEEPSIFLAGGITGCFDWQVIAAQMLLASTELVVLNPRRENFPIHDPLAAEAQIKWEHDHLRNASAILFWFPPETLCPIVLYELGAWTILASCGEKPIFVGCDPLYQRKRDVEIQTRLVDPSITVVDSLPSLIHEVQAWWKTSS